MRPEQDSSDDEGQISSDDNNASFRGADSAGDPMRRESMDDATSISQSDRSEMSANIQPYDFDNLPEHACAYCGIHEIDAVVQCDTKDCKKWFCNGKGINDFGSHAVLHMIKAKHKSFGLHKEAAIQTSLECYMCGSKNSFILGFVTAKMDTVIILLCREPCLNKI